MQRSSDLIGWLGHSAIAYGQLQMNVALARRAVSTLADTLGEGLEETAQAILDIAVSEIFVEVEKLASRAGVDLRDFALMPFGGGGPMLAAFLARELGMARVVAPRWPGVVSAFGGLVADLRGDFIRTVFAELDEGVSEQLGAVFRELAEEGRGWLTAQGYDGVADLTLTADMRYVGQSYEIETVLDPDWLGDPARIAKAFHANHRLIYDFDDPEGRIEIINLRLSAVGAGPKSNFLEEDNTPTPARPARHVPVYLAGIREVPLYDRAQLSSGAAFEGPAIVSQEDTTFTIPEGAQARVDRHLNIHLSFAE